MIDRQCTVPDLRCPRCRRSVGFVTTGEHRPAARRRIAVFVQCTAYGCGFRYWTTAQRAVNAAAELMLARLPHDSDSTGTI